MVIFPKIVSYCLTAVKYFHKKLHLRVVVPNTGFVVEAFSPSNPIDTGRKLDLHKTFRRRSGRFIYVQFTFCVYWVGVL